MLNRRRVEELAREAGLPLTKTLKAWPREGGLVTIEVGRPAAELAEELEGLGLWPPAGGA